MAAITYDGQSFLLDGRRVWIVSGSIPMSRVPRERWADRINEAKQAGLNTIETPLFWATHEPRAGQFDFSGAADVRAFVELVGQAGMYCILRPGPFVGHGWELGGLPSWLLNVDDLELRTASQPFLEACSRYITNVSQQVRDLQVTSPGDGGPILLIQNEAQWTCGADDIAQGYLRELNRYYREAGITAPIINANDLWQGVEGEIDCWRGHEGMLANTRQLGAVRPDQPKIVIDFFTGEATVWGAPAEPAPAPAEITRRLAEALAGGAQFNLSPFHGGTTFAFNAGRLPDEAEGFLTTSSDGGAPLDELGRRTPNYYAVRRVCTFASRFARVLAGLDAKRHPASGSPGGSAPVVVHTPGAQGDLVTVFAGSNSKSSEPVEVLTSEGMTLPAPIGAQGVAWLLFNAKLTGRAVLDYCNLSPFGITGDIFVCFGPAGAAGALSINGSPLDVETPKGKTPTVVEHEGLIVVVCNEDQIDATALGENEVYVGVHGLDYDRSPLAHPDYKTCTRIDKTGATNSVKAESAAGPARKASETKLAIADWSRADTAEYLDGTSARYASIDGPAHLAALGAPQGYGWYRIALKLSSGRRDTVMAPRSGDRLALFTDGKPAGLLGAGPGASDRVQHSMPKGEHNLVVLAENFGRLCGGSSLRSRAGLFGHLKAIKPFEAAGKPEIVVDEPVEILGFRAPIQDVQRGDSTDPERLTWTFIHRRKTPLILSLGRAAFRGLIILNGEPIEYIEFGARGPMLLANEILTRGKNVLQVALLDGDEALLAELGSQSALYEGVESLTAKGEWAFAKWEPPAPDAFEKLAKKDLVATGVPTWWRGVFQPKTAEALVVDLSGLTKGQLYVNGAHAGRYFVSTADGQDVPPQHLYHVPAGWVRAGEPNELMVFDEHGGAPTRVRVVTADAHEGPLVGA